MAEGETAALGDLLKRWAELGIYPHGDPLADWKRAPEMLLVKKTGSVEYWKKHHPVVTGPMPTVELTRYQLVEVR